MAGKRMLLAGGAHSDIPLIRAAQSLGFHVTTSGNRLEDLGHAESDAYAPCDYSDPRAVLALARELGVDAVCASCNDFSALSSAYAAAELGLPGHDLPEVSEVLHHKDRWRVFATANAIPSPRAVGCQSMGDVQAALQILSFPLMVKPVDLTGGKGITKVHDFDSALAAATAALQTSKAGRVVVEEFVKGTRHGFTAILRERRVVFYLMDDEYYHLSPYLVSAAAAPSSLDQRASNRLIEMSEAIAHKLRLVDGIFHVQFIQPEFGDPVIIEICRRAPGDLYVELVRHATGAPYARWIVSASVGMGVSEARQLPVSRSILRHCLMAHHAGTFRGFQFAPEMESRIIDRLIWGRVGDQVSQVETHKFGIVFLEFPDEATLRRLSPRMQRLLLAEVN